MGTKSSCSKTLHATIFTGIVQGVSLDCAIQIAADFVGPLIWYQKFEYAIAHWLQKATEHVLGCVLCSPGCFSLFRGEALMHENVMARYATTSTLARHYLQYDQGETVINIAFDHVLRIVLPSASLK